MCPTFILLLLLLLVYLWWQYYELVRALVAAALHAGAEMPPLEAGAPLEHSVQETGTLILVQASYRIAADADYPGAQLQPVQETLQGFLLEDVLQQGVGGLGTQESLYQRNLPSAMVAGVCAFKFEVSFLCAFARVVATLLICFVFMFPDSCSECELSMNFNAQSNCICVCVLFNFCIFILYSVVSPANFIMI